MSTGVIVYDQKGIFSAPRVWWMFAHFGHVPVGVLDGGLPAWRASGHPVRIGPPSEPAPARYVPRHYATQVRGLGDMLHNLETGEELVLDARPAGRYAGTEPEPRPGLPSGHIPVRSACRRRMCCWRGAPCCRRCRCARRSPRPGWMAPGRW